MGKIFLLMGKSASGKDAVYRNLLSDDTLALKKVVMYTTRPMRQNEENGRQYFFVDEAAYEKLVREEKIIEERAYHTQLGLWRYFTADDGQIDPEKGNYLMMGTVEAFATLKARFGGDMVVPVLIDTEDGIRLERALKRERKQDTPRYDEMCRRYLADTEDYAKEKLDEAGITRIFHNNDTLEACLAEVSAFVSEHVAAG